MSFRARLAALAAMIALTAPTLPAHAGGIEVAEAYARASSPIAPTGAVFMVIRNAPGAPEDRLTGVSSDAARRVELHGHVDAGGGVMRMKAAPEGFVLPAGGELRLERGGRHVMLMGLSQPLSEGTEITLVLQFQNAGALSVRVPVDLDPRRGMDAGHAASH